jgi:DNA mismatch endonuclease (patch repair protein)
MIEALVGAFRDRDRSMPQRKNLVLSQLQSRGTTAARSQIMRSIKSQGNRTTEQRLRFALVSHGIQGWVLHPKDLPGRPDFYFASRKLAVFVDGCFWHGCRVCGHIQRLKTPFWRSKIAGNRARDRRRTKDLIKKGIVVLRFWEHDLVHGTYSCIAAIKEAIDAC